MNKNRVNNIFRILSLCCFVLALASCSKDDAEPRIDSVWYNMMSRPVEQAPCAYPGQTLCIHGSGFQDLRMLMVNGTQINLNNILVYVADNYITFQVPADVNTSGDLIRVVTAHGKADFKFIIRPATEQPTFYYNSDSKTIPFSATTLVPGNTLAIRGTNLTGVKEVRLPLAFNKSIACEFDPTKENTDDYVYVIIPDVKDFATGRCELVLERYDAERDLSYTEKVYSEETNFIN